MRVVLDTNVLVSALYSAYGVPAKIVEAITNGLITPCFNEEILAEYADVLSRPRLKFETIRIVELITLLKQFGQDISGFEQSSIPLPDEDDRVFYDVAKACGAILITGNTKHFPLEPIVVTPREFSDTYLGRVGYEAT